ncbi:SnoaL-like domain-containing protein [Marinoscillum sp.]|uniref:SnoaL-like domain-containing protein n=1 Tax=Marinoscillum sp. TaxID=2024838 RepID=UPI003BA95C7A
MTTQEVANQLVKLCREGKFEQVLTELYAPDIMSVEPEGSTWPTVQGMAQIMKKGEIWTKMVEEVLESEISEPIVADTFFSITMKSRVKIKDVPEPVRMDEVCVYQVRDGKVVLEQFFYQPVMQEA